MMTYTFLTSSACAQKTIVYQNSMIQVVRKQDLEEGEKEALLRIARQFHLAEIRVY